MILFTILILVTNCFSTVSCTFAVSRVETVLTKIMREETAYTEFDTLFLRSFQVAIQKLKDQDIQNYNFTPGFVWV